MKRAFLYLYISGDGELVLQGFRSDDSIQVTRLTRFDVMSFDRGVELSFATMAFWIRNQYLYIDRGE